MTSDGFSSDDAKGPRQIHDVHDLNERLQAITRRAKTDLRFLHDDRSRSYIANELQSSDRILDVGDGMRDQRATLTGQVESLDLNDIDEAETNLTRPDILGDVCSPFPDWMHQRYDAVIALAILEHVYDPPAAVQNFRAALKPHGRLFLYVPWMWRYHAPKSLIFQDYQRYSRDGMAYLLRDFEDVVLYPIRGKYSAILNMLKFWKPRVEKPFGGALNRMVDSRTSPWRNMMQASGFFAEARRPGRDD
ncbi:MAG: methyltransferase domain-containing protein [Pseudomonadota bacterium]